MAITVKFGVTSTILGQTIWKDGVIINDRDRWDDFKSPLKKNNSI